MQQYTVRNVPDAIDSALRERAGRERRSLNEIVIETLRRGLGVTDDTVQYSDLDDLAGMWQEDPVFDLAVAEQDRVDQDLWR